MPNLRRRSATLRLGEALAAGAAPGRVLFICGGPGRGQDYAGQRPAAGRWATPAGPRVRPMPWLNLTRFRDYTYITLISIASRIARMAEFGLPGVLQPGLALRRRMAGEGRGPAVARRTCTSGSISTAKRGARAWKRAPTAGRSWLSSLHASGRKRRSVSRASGRRATTRASPSSPRRSSSTRIFSVKDPERLVLDLEVGELSPRARRAEQQGRRRATRTSRACAWRATARAWCAWCSTSRPRCRPQVFTLQADRRLRPPPGARHLSAGRGRPARRAARRDRKSSARRRKSRAPAAPASPPSSSTPGTAARIPGAIGRRGSREKDITLSIARRLKALIDDEPNMRALLTRDGDYFLRSARASRRRAR